MQIAPFSPYGPTNYFSVTTTPPTGLAPANFAGTAAGAQPAPPSAGGVSTYRFMITSVAGGALEVHVGYSNASAAQAATNAVVPTAGVPQTVLAFPAVIGIYDFVLPAGTFVSPRTDVGTAEMYLTPGDGGR